MARTRIHGGHWSATSSPEARSWERCPRCSKPVIWPGSDGTSRLYWAISLGLGESRLSVQQEPRRERGCRPRLFASCHGGL